jgi:hypothetical protein
MQEQELISKIKELRNIKPNQNWVAFTKTKILGEEQKTNWVSVLEFFPGLVYRHSRLAFASLIIFGIIAAAFGFSQGALPGDPIYALKRLSEKTSLSFVSERNLPDVQLALANKRLDELNTIIQTNQIKKIAPAVQEFQANISKAAKDLVRAQDNIDINKIVVETRKIKDGRQKIESLGGIVGDTKEFDNALSQLIDRELKDAETRTLTENQQKVLTTAKEKFAAEDYAGALEEILLLNCPEN